VHGLAIQAAPVLALEVGAEVLFGVEFRAVLVIQQSADLARKGVGRALVAHGAPFSAHSEFHASHEVRLANVVHDADVRFGAVWVVDLDRREGPLGAVPAVDGNPLDLFVVAVVFLSGMAN